MQKTLTIELFITTFWPRLADKAHIS